MHPDMPVALGMRVRPPGELRGWRVTIIDDGQVVQVRGPGRSKATLNVPWEQFHEHWQPYPFARRAQ